LVQNGTPLEGLAGLKFEACGAASVAGRSLELVLEKIRGRSDRLGAALMRQKRAAGRILSAIGVERLPVGEIGFDPAGVNVGISRLSLDLLKRFDAVEIRRKRRKNFMLMRAKLAGRAAFLRPDLDEGVCPLFFPILAADKPAAARALRLRGVETIEFWNHGDPAATRESFPDAHFLRDHVLELPIHQDITPEQVDYTAEQVLELKLKL
jgi:perosamine synthetase